MKFLIASFIGAVIGYITNWLAIKMLFRPHEEKRLFGFKLPFTPGLIPKERHRMAKSVGETVGEHLLTKEAIIEALCSEKMNAQITGWIGARIAEMKESSSTIGDEIKSAAGERYEDISAALVNRIGELVITGIRDGETTKRILQGIEDYARQGLDTSTETILSSDYFIKLKKSLLGKFGEIRNSPGFEEMLKKYIVERLQGLKDSDKNINEVVPESILEAVKTYVFNNREDISKGIGEMLKQPETEDRIKKVISSIISSNLSPLVAMFINPDMIYGKLSTALQEYLQEDDNQRNTVLAINQAIDRIAGNKIADLLGNLSEEERNNNVIAITGFIRTNVLTLQFVENASNDIEEKLKGYGTINELLINIDSEYMLVLKEIIRSKVDDFINSSEFEKIVKRLSQEGLVRVLDMPVKELISGNEESITSMAVDVSENIIDKLVVSESADIIEALNIPKIVEERINSFDVAFAEKIIIDIANRELSAITWLGALLGAIIGIVSPLLERIY